MPADVTIPKLGMTMREGTVQTWLKDAGAPVRAGEPIFLLVTEKTETEIEAEIDGFLERIAAEGDTLEVGALIGRIVEAPAVPTEAAPTVAHAVPPRVLASPLARRRAREHGIDLRTLTGSGPGARVVARDLAGTHAPPAPPAPRPSHAALMVAGKLGVDPTEVVPANPRAGLTRQDVERHVAERLSTSAVPGDSAPTARPSAASGSQLVPHTAMRRTIASRMQASLAQSAQLTMTMDVQLQRAERLRRWFRRDLPDSSPTPTVTDLVVKATANALRAHPTFNSTWHNEHLEIHDGVHIGLAVAVEGGLLVPAIRDADVLSLGVVARVTREVAERARAGALSFDDLEGATFSVSALGAFGVRSFTPILNPPNTGIIGIGAMRGKQPKLTLSLTWDHRVADGVAAARFLGDVRDALQRPMSLLQPALVPPTT